MKYLIPILLLCCYACSSNEPVPSQVQTPVAPTQSHIQVLGIAQDAGFPQAACKKACCAKVWAGEVERELVSCLGLFQHSMKKAWLFDATPDFKDQLKIIEEKGYELAGIFINAKNENVFGGEWALGAASEQGQYRLSYFADR